MDALASDPRWQLVTRVVDSAAFSRAKQLRDFLLYSSRWSLIHPGEPLSESDIAQNVMGRRDDFDAAHDNIVRVQATHLRRKLDTFFSTEGRDEETIVILPKGAYTPVFVPSKSKTVAEPPNDEAELIGVQPPTPLIQELEQESTPPPTRQVQWPWLLVAALALVCLTLAFRLVALSGRVEMQAAPKAKSQTILTPLIRNGKPITIILPDLGLSVVQNLLHKEVDPQEYASGRFPENVLHDVDDPHVRDAINYIGMRRAISYSELNGVLELVKHLQADGLSPSVRFARDIHVRDLSTDNIILIGSRRSNPWVSLFTDRTNFRFIADPQTQEFYFDNRNPQDKEEKRYLPTYTPHGGNAYVDVAILANTTNSGFILLIDGSDAEVNESAMRYLLDGNFPASLQEALNRPKLRSFELFLGARHLMNEADNEIQIIGSRLGNPD